MYNWLVLGTPSRYLICSGNSSLSDDVYKPPAAELTLESTEQQEQRFYVVSKLKFTVLYLATVGLYEVYWFYANWHNYRKVTGEKVLPILRAIFYVFFTHSLFLKVDAHLKYQEIEFHWRPRWLATLFVIVVVVGNILDRLSVREIGSPLTDILSLVLLVPALLIALKAQEAINLGQDDPDGRSNCRFSVYNYLWIALGAAFWILISAGLLALFGLLPVDF